MVSVNGTEDFPWYLHQVQFDHLRSTHTEGTWTPEEDQIIQVYSHPLVVSGLPRSVSRVLNDDQKPAAQVDVYVSSWAKT